MKKISVSIGLIFLSMLGVFAYAYAEIIQYRQVEVEVPRQATAIILGAQVKADGSPSQSLKLRLDRALALNEEKPFSQVIVTGGQGHDEPITEASAMKHYLVEHGMDESVIEMENRSTSTYENLVNASKFLGDHKEVVIISNDFHLKRTKLLAEKIGLQPILVAAKTPESSQFKLELREVLALTKTWLVGK